MFRIPAATRAATLVTAALFGASAAMAQGAPEPTFNARNVALELSAGSLLRRGDRLTDALVATIWTRMLVKGSGTCSAGACPVLFNGEEVFVRRTRVTIVGASSGRGSAGATGTGGTAANSDGRKFRRGDSGDDVRRLQDALIRDGARLTADGTYGRGTRAAVADYQRRRNLKVDGVAGGDTLRALGV
jgi:Putative peptidoglycan binding domain